MDEFFAEVSQSVCPLWQITEEETEKAPSNYIFSNMSTLFPFYVWAFVLLLSKKNVNGRLVKRNLYFLLSEDGLI